MAKRPKSITSLIRIADVLKVGQKLTTSEDGVRLYFLPGLDASICSLPAGSQGGDFYGMVYLGNDRTAVFVGDISGHDFSSSIVAAQVIEYIDNHREDLEAPHLFLHHIARRLYDNLTSLGRFFTMAACVVDTARDELIFSCAGHPPALLYSASSREITELGFKGMPPGFEEDISYQCLRRPFAPGDILLMYTDGLSSARSPEREELGLDRIQRLLGRLASDPPSVIPQLLGATKAFTRSDKNQDDVTIICLSRSKT